MAKPKNLAALFAKPCTCLLAAGEPEQFPEKPRLPEIAFVGRSNVGKSSLINALLGRRNLARASNTPGRTQQIVFFELYHSLMLVDLPGYGHAKAPLSIIKSWNRLMGAYLTERARLQCVMLLIDARHGPLKKDYEMMELLDEYAVNYQAVLTKADYLKPAEQAQRKEELETLLKKHPAARPEALITSSAKKTGLEDLQAFIAHFSK